MSADRPVGDARWVLLKSTGGAGLGDSIRALLSALHFATLSGRRLAVCWDDGLYGPSGVNVISDLLEIVAFPLADIAALDSRDVHPPAWAGKLATPLNQRYGELRDDDWNRGWALRNLSFDQTRFDYPEPVLVMWDFDGYAASWDATDPRRRVGVSADNALRLLARRHLRPAVDVLDRVRAVHADQFAPRMIGVHVRKTFEKGGASRHMDLDAVFPILDFLLGGRGGQVGIFLATDNHEVEVAFRARYPRIAATRKWFGSAGVALHFNEAAPNKTHVAVEAMVDLYLLAACDCLIHPSGSSFSRVAAVLGDIPPRRVYSMPPGPPTWRLRLRKRLWTLRARRWLVRRAAEMPYFLQS